MTRLKYLTFRIPSILRCFPGKILGKISHLKLREFSAKKLAQESGQAILEYTLLLVIVVTILTGSIYQFSSAFQAFTDSYFGDYLQCLIESGELPQLGGDDEGICNSSFQAFSLANGRPIDSSSTNSASGSSGDSNVGGGGVYGGSNPNSSGTTVGRAPGTSVGAGSSSGNLGASSGGPGSSSGNSGGSLGGGRTNRVSVGGQGNKGAFGNNKNKKVPFNPTANTYTDLGANGSGSGLRSRRILRSYGSETEGGDIEGGPNASSNAVAGVAGQGGRDKKVPISERKPASNDDEVQEMSFGNFMRYLVIFCMVVAVILFLGGQIQSITKSMD